MKKMNSIFFPMLLAMAICLVSTGCSTKPTPTSKTTTIINSDGLTADQEQEKNYAVAHYHDFLDATTLRGGLESLSYVDMCLGKGSLSHGTISVKGADIDRKVRDLVLQELRNRKAKAVHHQPATAHHKSTYHHPTVHYNPRPKRR